MESPEDGTGFIRSRFGIEIGKQHFSVTGSRITKKGGTAAPKGTAGDRNVQLTSGRMV